MNIRLQRTGDEIAEIYHRYVDMVYRICFMLLKNTAESEDATQTVFIKLIQTPKEFENDTHMKSWLIVTARNTCKDILRSSWRSKRTDLDDNKFSTGSIDCRQSDIWEAVTALPAKYKLPVYLYYYEGYTTMEISKMLHVNHATLRTRLRAAKQKLKLLLEEDLAND